MAKIGEEAAFFVVVVHYLLGALVNRVDEDVKKFLSRTDQAIYFRLLYSSLAILKFPSIFIYSQW